MDLGCTGTWLLVLVGGTLACEVLKWMLKKLEECKWINK